MIIEMVMEKEAYIAALIVIKKRLKKKKKVLDAMGLLW